MWLHVPNTALRSAPESAASTSESNSPCPTTAPSATWRGKPLQPRSWPRAWRTAPWLRRLSGLTCSPSTAALGVESWISSLRASRANHTASPGSAAEPKTNGGSGPTSFGSFVRFDPRTSSWKMSQGFLPLAGSTPVSLTWPRSGSMRSGECFARPMLAPLTSGRGCSSWVTPTAGDAKESCNSTATRHRTPPTGVHAGDTLTDLIRKWPTPRGSDGKKGGPNSRDSSGSLHMASAAVRWATPTARDWKDGACAEADVPTNGLLGRQAVRSSLPGPTTPTDGVPTSSTAAPHQLNPAFVEALMGLPPGWTDFAPLGTASCRYRQRMRSALCGSDFTGSR